MSVTTTPLDAWQQALSVEYAAVYGYAALGPQLTDAAQANLARAVERAHRALAQASAQLLVAAGQTPVSGEATYPLPWPISDVTAALRLALRLEESATSAWRFLVAATSAPPTAGSTSTATTTTTPVTPTPIVTPSPGLGGAGLNALRALAIDALGDCAVRAVQWRRILDATTERRVSRYLIR